jgi:uncharacterized protein DUF6600
MIFFRQCAAAVLFAIAAPACAAAAAEPAPPVPQNYASAEVGLAFFEQRLAIFGRWFQHPVWGAVWQPDSGANFRPYFYGYWQYTADYGWLWVSNEPYGDIVYHYGRWVFDPSYGWLWVPGYVWGPGWVAWRQTDSDGGYVGWLPLPPGNQDFSLNAIAPSYLSDDWYGYRSFYGNNFASDVFASLWVFVPVQGFAVRERRPYVIDRMRLQDLYRRSHDHTNYVQDREHDRVVDRSIDKDALERATHRSFGAQQSRQFLRRDVPIVSLSQGQELSRHNRDAGKRPAAIGAQPGISLPGRDNPVPGRIGVRPDDRPSTDFAPPRRLAYPAGETPKPVPQIVPEQTAPGALRERARIGGIVRQGEMPPVPALPHGANIAAPSLPQARIVQPLLLHQGPAVLRPATPAVTPQQHQDIDAGREGVRR